MRKITFSLLLFASILCGAADVVIDGSSQIVLREGAPYATRLAAAELNVFLKGVIGVPIPVVAQRTEGKTAIMLGAVGSRVPRDRGHAGRVPLPHQKHRAGRKDAHELVRRQHALAHAQLVEIAADVAGVA